MRIELKNWSVQELFDERTKFNLNPAWQRGPAWHYTRQSLLIDSILRGMDIPKIYLRTMGNGSVYSHEVVDGQQRLRTLWLFKEDRLELAFAETPENIDQTSVLGLKYGTLPRPLKDRFDQFAVNIAEIVEGTSDEITNLFSRLQMGVSLNPAELRNAVLGAMRHVVDLVATSHRFFVESRISDQRYKRQDYAAHIFAMSVYQGLGDIKAPDLKRMFLDYKTGRQEDVLAHFANVGSALSVLADVNAKARYKITQKWIFVDLVWLIMQRHAIGAAIDVDKFAAKYAAFEADRRLYIAKPEELLTMRGRGATIRRQLYNYIIAFKAQGGTKENLEARNTALTTFFQDIEAN